MKSCKYNDFEIRFISQNESDEIVFSKKYDFAFFESGEFRRELLFARSKHQVIFEANKYFQQLGNCEKMIVLENGAENISFLWTSLKGKHEKINMRGGKRHLFDYLFLTFIKKKSRCLYIGNSFEAPLAGWRNSCSVDVLHTNEKIIEIYLKQTQELYLPF